MNRTRLRACQLRRSPTDAERLLWQKLRYWQIDGLKFRRQQPLGRYIVDFVCLERRLIVELDGGQHAEHGNYNGDRDAWLSRQRFTVLRFWNNDIFHNIEGVMDRISKLCKAPPSSFVPRKGEGDGRGDESIQHNSALNRALEFFNL